MDNFKALAQCCSGRFFNMVILTSRYGDIPVECKVLLDKVEKHAKAGNARSVACYLAMFRKEYASTPMPEKAKEIAQRIGIVHNQNGFGYPHSDGTYHYFSVSK